MSGLPKSKMGVDLETGEFGTDASPSRRRPSPSSRTRRTTAKRSTWPPTRTGKGRPSPGI
ncbi:MAG: hypothetical protein ACLS43_09530 [Evtepia gabavorous]